MTPFDTITQQIISLLEQGVVPWRRPWAYRTGERPTNPIGRTDYRGINLPLLQFVQEARGYRTPCWCTLNQAEKKGWHVKKGEAPSSVIAWRPPPSDQDGSNPKDQRWFLRTHMVFNFDQIKGAKPPQQEHPVPHRPIEEAEQVAIGYASRGGPEARLQGNRACYLPKDDQVFVPPMDAFTSPEKFYCTLFHELGHSTGHAKRLKRPGVSDGVSMLHGDEPYAKEELVAEMTAAFLCGHAGIKDMLPHNASYIAGWIKALRNDRRLVITAASQAQRAADFILGRHKASPKKSR